MLKKETCKLFIRAIFDINVQVQTGYSIMYMGIIHSISIISHTLTFR